MGLRAKPNNGIIENISSSGVTIEQLFNQAHYFIYCVPSTLGLTEHEKITIANDAAMNIHKKMLEGTVNNTEYDQFKNYLFSCVRYAANSLWKKKHSNSKYNIHNRLDPLDQIDDLAIEEPEESEIERIYQQQIFFKALEKLPSLKKEMAKQLLEGKSARSLSTKYNKSKHFVEAIPYQIYKIIKKEYPNAVKKQVTRYEDFRRKQK